MSLTDPSPATRSPSQIALSSQSGFAHPARAVLLPSDSVEARGGVLIGPASAALILLGPSLAQSGCSPALRALEQVSLRCLRLAGRGFAQLWAVMGLPRPEPLRLLSQGADVIVPGRRAVTTICGPYPLPVHFEPPPWWRDQNTTREVSGVGQSFSDLRKVAPDGCGR